MSATETQTQRALSDAAVALRRVEWSAQAGSKCPTCSRAKAYGMHVCSCPIGLAFKALTKAGVDIQRAESKPPANEPLALAEIPLVEWARWSWLDVTTGGDKRRQFIRLKERTPDEVAAAIRSYQELLADHPALFEEKAARP